MSASLSRISVFAALCLVATALPRLPDKPGQTVRAPKKLAEGPKAVSPALNVADTITTETQDVTSISSGVTVSAAKTHKSRNSQTVSADPSGYSYSGAEDTYGGGDHTPVVSIPAHIVDSYGVSSDAPTTTTATTKAATQAAAEATTPAATTPSTEATTGANIVANETSPTTTEPITTVTTAAATASSSAVPEATTVADVPATPDLSNATEAALNETFFNFMPLRMKPLVPASATKKIKDVMLENLKKDNATEDVCSCEYVAEEDSAVQNFFSVKSEDEEAQAEALTEVAVVVLTGAFLDDEEYIRIPTANLRTYKLNRMQLHECKRDVGQCRPSFKRHAFRSKAMSHKTVVVPFHKIIRA